MLNESVAQALQRIRQQADATPWQERFTAEMYFAGQLAASRPEQGWEALLAGALAAVQAALDDGASAQTAVLRGEEVLAPLGAAAKSYTIHCVGHAHLDMNWRWNWPETVAATNDTFTTVDRLMEHFPTFHFSQSQAEQYRILREYLPELYERVRRRVREGRWEVTASQWVEGDKNLVSGESLCRQALYSRRFLREAFDLPEAAVKVCWEPDTFGHPHTLPAILARAGVRYYYFTRGFSGPQLFWWQGSDGSRLLAFCDAAATYSGPLTPRIAEPLLEFERATGLKDYLVVYGVGDHGGGPTRRDLQLALAMARWPIFPTIAFSTAARFFAVAEAGARDLPVVDRELNFLNEGCYTSQSKIKFANRKSENLLLETEMFALLAGRLADMPYPEAAFAKAWHATLFNQFHDILPGSGIHETYEHALGCYQETLAQATMVKTRALRLLAGRIPTVQLCPDAAAPGEVGDGIGGGAGQIYRDGELSVYGAGPSCGDPVVVFNPSPWTRSELVLARIWDRRHYADDRIVVLDDRGAEIPGQVIERGPFDDHYYITVAFPAREIGGLGYRAYNILPAPQPAAAAGCRLVDSRILENAYLRVEVEPQSGAITHLIDKRTGLDLVPPGERLGALEYLVEAPHAASAWTIGRIIERREPLAGATLTAAQQGPYLASVVLNGAFRNSSYALTISLTAGVPRVDFALDVNWLEIGSDQVGVPMLRAAFPLAMTDTRATYECPHGAIARTTNPRDTATLSLAQHEFHDLPLDPYPGEAPALRWADLSGTHAAGGALGATLLNEAKYGHNVDGNVLRLTLLRSSYRPDPLPELGRHRIRYALQPHGEDWSPAAAARWGYDYNLPCNVVNTTDHDGDLPLAQGMVELLTPQVMLSALKKAEDGDGMIVRLYEMAGTPVTAQLRFHPAFIAPDAAVAETDLCEQPLDTQTARMADGILSVAVPAHGITTVKIG